MVEVGSIVTILPEEFRFHGKQGEVIDIIDDGDKDGNILVRIEAPDAHPPNPEVRCKETELQIDQEWSLEIRANRVFGSGKYHSLHSLSNPFDPEKECSEDCQVKNSRRVLINIWGSVCEFDLCEPHAKEWHGKHADSLPKKKKTKQTV